MSGNAQHAIYALNQDFLQLHPLQAEQAVNQLSADDLVELIQKLPASEMIIVWDGLMLDVATRILLRLPETHLKRILNRGNPVHIARVLIRLAVNERERLMLLVDNTRKHELITLVQYPEESAGSLMNPRFLILNESLTVREVLRRIRKFKPRFSRQLYVVDSEGRLQSMVELHQLALAEAGDKLNTLTQAVPGFVTATATREEVVEQLDIHRVTDLAVVDLDGYLIGIIHYDALMEAVREESSIDILTMVGASRDERALSPVSFVVRKRLPWLSINLLTAFLAASVVGLFEDTIAKFTALAVLLPVVAGQSGNTGAQALAVTMRGLALREIGTSQWLRVVKKEVGASFINGLAIALLTAFGVLVWSSSVGLALVIGSSMVIAMVAAALSGVIVPVVLSSLGQDPAQSSSIILTTVTDIVGFFAFLGIATLLSTML
ncbi:MAG: magnesium transporter [Gammaproteobacteria bacterium]|nr:magnesium transporter [Gammaproteobacteria bacterium]MCW8986568.1 magnesium transporter [Gammaproteobacteria bacterium]MCW9031977.1 magnesium transporter [Gammaproteobacteria bacterium]